MEQPFPGTRQLAVAPHARRPTCRCNTRKIIDLMTPRHLSSRLATGTMPGKVWGPVVLGNTLARGPGDPDPCAISG